MKRWIWLPLLPVVLAVGCLNENPMTAEESSPGLIPEAPKMVEFLAHEENTIIPLGGDACTLLASFPGVIEGDHIGSGTIAATSVVDFCGVVQTTESVITAANGDQLFFETVGTFDASDPANVSFWGDFTFTGGTGRFGSATGGGTYAGTADTIAGSGQYDMTGMISK